MANINQKQISNRKYQISNQCFQYNFVPLEFFNMFSLFDFLVKEVGALDNL